MPPGLARLSDTANVLNAGGPLRPPFIQDLLDTRPMEVFEAFVVIEPTLLPPRSILRFALMHVHLTEGRRVLPTGPVDPVVEVADGVAWLLRLILGRFRELATNHVRRGQMHKLSNRAQKEMLHKVVGRVALTQNTCTPTSRSLSPSTSASRSHCSGVDARRLDDDASLEAELALSLIHI